MSKKFKSEKIRNEAAKYLYIVIGTFLFAIGVNIFIEPLEMYNGGIVGAAQLITLGISKFIDVPESINLYGIVFLLVNLPLLFIAIKDIGRGFFVKTVFATVILSAFMALIPVPAAPIIEDQLSAGIIAGIITGYGIGMLLRSGGSAGGSEILGMLLSKKVKWLTVGKMNMFINIVVYGICFFVSDAEIAIYSILYAAVYAFALDKFHYQNINISMMIFTKKEGIDKVIMERTGRGVTKWKGEGAYTHEDTNILVVMANKYEAPFIKHMIHEIDDRAFVIISEGLSVEGNFEKRIY